MSSAVAPASIDLTGKHVGGFEVWGPLGEGGMSKVWLARHRELAYPVVIKTLREDFAHSQRLRDEARLMARIQGPRVVRILDAGKIEDTPYLAQEYVDGIDLSELDRRRRATLGVGLPLWFVCEVAAHTAEALQSAHRAGVWHRDVKPSNLLGSPIFGTRLGDFGIAYARGLEEGDPIGTLHFLAPEVLRHAAPSRQVDIYALGATAFALRYGRPPYERIDDLLSGKPLQFPQATTPEEAFFQHTVAVALQPDPAARFASASRPHRLFSALARGLKPRMGAIAIRHGAFQIGPVRVWCRLGDIADSSADGIVSSANDGMLMRSGVGEALRVRGGNVIEDEAQSGGRRALGDCIATKAGSLKAQYVLHAVSAWKQASCIARTCQRAFLLANELKLRSLSIPALGTGAAQVGPEPCANAAAQALRQHLSLGGSTLRDVEFVLLDEATYEIFIECLEELFLGAGDPSPDHGNVSTRSVAEGPTALLPTFED